MRKLRIETNDPNFRRDLEEANIPDLSVKETGRWVREYASIDAPSAKTILILFTVQFASGLGARLLGDWIHDRIVQGNSYKIKIEDQEVTKNPEKIPAIINECIQQTQIGVKPKPSSQEESQSSD
jgi:hypothetical protein